MTLLVQKIGVNDFPVCDLFAWPESSHSLVSEMMARLDQSDPASFRGGHDHLRDLYQQLLPKSVRHALGEYYTPDWLVEHILDQLGYDGNPDRRLLDPACGSRTFLLAAIRRIRKWYDLRGGAPKRIANVIGFDLNPLAVMAARANYLLAVRDLVGHVDDIEIPTYCCDSILDRFDAWMTQVDYVVGNPPWIAWDNLPVDYRDRTKPLWERYGLFTLSHSAARHGGGKKDISMLMLYAAADRYLCDGGKLGFVITQTMFQTKGAGDGFRRFRIGSDGPGLRVWRVDDMAGFRPFENAANWTSAIFLQKGEETRYPVDYVKWAQAGGKEHFKLTEFQAQPIDPSRPTSPWIVTPKHGSIGSGFIGVSDYQAHLGANTGGANGVYWMRILDRSGGNLRIQNAAERSKRPLAAIERTIEPDLLFPLIRWLDVQRFSAAPSLYILLAQDTLTRTAIEEASFRTKWSKSYAYLLEFKDLLLRRAAYKKYRECLPPGNPINTGC